ncbi:hypothetical protein ODS41_11875 [Pyrobaculum sp. 3827-6]|nr:hypothetical protein [Pyrobaculum sp. 3827-6]MCU7788610.1 hypothetical protein [Pyrobaculum sp. 3827-6]
MPRSAHVGSRRIDASGALLARRFRLSSLLYLSIPKSFNAATVFW